MRRETAFLRLLAVGRRCALSLRGRRVVGLLISSIRHGRITTTLIRAKAVRKHVDHMVQLAKRGDLHSRRQAMAWIYDKQLVHAMFDAVPERYADREGGYCRVLRTMPRKGDNAKMGILELV